MRAPGQGAPYGADPRCTSCVNVPGPMRALVLAAVMVAVSGRSARATRLPGVAGLYTPQGSALPMLDSRMTVSVHGPLVEVVVVQRFTNRTAHATEGTYIFPLPADAAVSAMAIEVGDRTIHAAVERRAAARARYEQAVQAGVGAALLDQERPDIFTQTVAAIPAAGTVEVTLRYDTLAWYRSGTWELAVPLVVAPRFVPGIATARPTTGMGSAPDTDRAPDASRVTPQTSPGGGGPTTIAVTFGEPVTAIASPTHEIATTGATTTLTDPHSDHDAILRWHATTDAAGWVESEPAGAPGGDAAFAAVLVTAPELGAVRLPHKAMTWTLLLDRSAASRGDAEAVAHPLVRALLAATPASDRVAVIGSDQLAAASAGTIARALEAAWTTQPGALDLSRTLRAAAPAAGPILLVSSGLVADDAAVLAAARRLGVPVHVIGVGPAPARGLLAQIAGLTGGTLRFAVPGDDVGQLAAQVLADASAPPAPLAVTWGTLAARDLVPGALPRLGAGQATIVLARVAHAGAANARVRGDLFAFDAVPVGVPPEGTTVALGPLGRRWARARLDELIGGRATEAAITAHALRYGLVSPYTSMVAIGTEVVVQGGVKHSVTVPVAVPAGMKWQAVKQETTVDVATDASRDAREEQDPSTHPTGPTRPTRVTDATTATGPTGATTAPRAERPATVSPADAPPAAAAPSQSAAEGASESTFGADTGTAAAAGAAGADGADEDEAAPRPESLDRATPEASAVAIDSVTGARSFRTRRALRIGLSLGAGLSLVGPDTAGHLALGGRIEYGARTRAGIEGTLWYVLGRAGGDGAEGTLLAQVTRMIDQRAEASVGLGLHVADGVGPAAALTLRYHLVPWSAYSLFVRYDGALVDRSSADPSDRRRAQHALTFGFGATF